MEPALPGVSVVDELRVAIQAHGTEAFFSEVGAPAPRSAQPPETLRDAEVFGLEAKENAHQPLLAVVTGAERRIGRV